MTTSDTPRMAARERITALVERYRDVHQTGADRRYNEARTVNEFILPLFQALEWDIHNRERRDEVLPELPAATGRADWAFAIRGITRFLVEAKSLSAPIGNPQFARQAINYAYSRGVTWAVLTNFAELRVYNAEWALPDPDLSRFISFRWDEYLSDFDRLWLLSRTAIDDGLLDSEAERYGRKRRKAPVGEQLFSDLITFRGDLRKTLIAYNPEVSREVIDHAVQRLLDRLIFMRAAEDREIEEPQLRPLLRYLEQSNKRSALWDRLRILFRDWDRRYDSQLFADQPLDHLETEVEPIWQTIKGLHETDGGFTQYDFRGIDADVLGGVYEQYLGHLARVESTVSRKGSRPAKRTKADTTRTIRKARGVYYTPKWLVRYIVAGALRPILDRSTPEQIRGLRIIDPACGSGSFLVEAFRILAQFWTQLERPGSDLAAFDLRLRILRENLFGVDLDEQAVEIAQLNLLLAALNQPALLPDLTHNFDVANALFDTVTRQIPSELQSGGWLTPIQRGPRQEFHRSYDVVVMNPPYYDLQLHPLQQSVLRSVYPEVSSGHDDILYYFLARAVDLLKPGGQLGCVVARYWLDSHYASRLRSHLAAAFDIREVVDFQSFQPFGRDVGVNAAIVLAQAGGSTASARLLTPAADGFGELPPELIESIASLEPGPPEYREAWFVPSDSPWHAPPRPQSRATRRLAELAFLTQGVKTGRNDVFVLDAARAVSLGLEADGLRPVLEGEDIGAFVMQNRRQVLLYLDGTRSISEFPRIAKYLAEHRTALEARAEVSRGAYPWWRLQRPRKSPVVDAPLRLIAPQLATEPRFSAVVNSGELSGALGLTDTLMLSVLDDALDPYYLLAVLNSDYGRAWTRSNTKMKRGGYREFFATTIGHLPVPVLDDASQELLGEYARELQTIVPAAKQRARKGRFDEDLNAGEYRASLLAEINALLSGFR